MKEYIGSGDFIEIKEARHPYTDIIKKGDILWVLDGNIFSKESMVNTYTYREKSTRASFHLNTNYYDYEIVSADYVKNVIDNDLYKVRHFTNIPHCYKKDNEVLTYFEMKR